MTKKELNAIVEGIVNTVLLQITATDPDTGLARPETYEATSAEQDEARTMVGITLKKQRRLILAAVPGYVPTVVAAPVAEVPAPVAETADVS